MQHNKYKTVTGGFHISFESEAGKRINDNTIRTDDY